MKKNSSPGITLCMIVKDEAPVIRRCLESVKPLITDWVIVDTGSTDSTKEIVKETMRGIPGELVDRAWVDFAVNRNEALALVGKGDNYVLVIDADDVLEFGEDVDLTKLVDPAYQLEVVYGNITYWRTHIFKPSCGFVYKGVVHEVLVAPEGVSEHRLEGIKYVVRVEGGRSKDPEKYRKDAAVLEKACAEYPGDPRYRFYLAQSWRDCGELERARSHYRARTLMGGWDEEVYYSKFEVAKLTALLGESPAHVIAAYLEAYEQRPTRAEPLCFLAYYMRAIERVVAALPFARAAAAISKPPDRLFVDESVYAWRSLDEFAVAAFWAGHYREALDANLELLGRELPGVERARVFTNVQHCRDRLGLNAG